MIYHRLQVCAGKIHVYAQKGSPLQTTECEKLDGSNEAVNIQDDIWLFAGLEKEKTLGLISLT